jgi:hypothetical protein
MPPRSSTKAKDKSTSKKDKPSSADVEAALKSEPFTPPTKDLPDIPLEEKEDADKAEKGTIVGLPILPQDETVDFFNMLIYGESGVGKTTLSGSASAVPELSPVLLIDVEGGRKSLRGVYPDVKVIEVFKWRDLQKVYDDLATGNLEFKTLIVDSLSEVQMVSLDYSLRYAIKQKEEGADAEVPRQRDWMRNIEQTVRFTRGFRDLPMNVIFTALVDQEKNKKNKVENKPMFSGKVKQKVPGFMDIVLYYYMDGRDRVLLTQKTDTTIAKDRSNKLPKPTMLNPTMQDIYNALKSTEVVQAQGASE